jgi:transcriptional regulator CtsR
LKAPKDGYNRNKEKWLRKVKISSDTACKRLKQEFTSRPTHNKIEMKVKQSQRVKDMKRSLADKIEQYLKVLIDRSEENRIEIQRSELAETFSCVPSQVTYVISTRFTEQDGYITESRRGGKGYVRIARYNLPHDTENLNDLFYYSNYLTRNKLISSQENELLTYLLLHAFNQFPCETQEKIFEGIKTALNEYVKTESKGG